jgi:hypothetical protein
MRENSVIYRGVVFGIFKRDPEKDRFYLLPGMGGRALRRKRKVILIWSIIAGLLTSGMVAAMLFFISRQR